MNDHYPISVHNFLLPFKWNYLPSQYKPEAGKQPFDFDERTDLGKFNEKIKDGLFERKFFKIDKDPLNYNEINYFHGFIYKSIYDLQQADEPTVNQVSKNKTILYYEIPINEQSAYVIDTQKDTYRLQLTGISLHVFNTGTAIITFNLENHAYKESEQILQINEFGRRLYPPFLAGDEGNQTHIPKGIMLATKIKIELPSLTIQEDFCGFDNLTQVETHCFDPERKKYGQIIVFPNHITKLFNENFTFKPKVTGGEIIRINAVGDDRMFYQCWYGNNSISKRLKQYGKKEFDSKNNFWFAFTNGDKSSKDLGLDSQELQMELAKNRTYRLWEGYGTFYGFTRESFVSLSNEQSSFIGIHMRHMYYQMCVLALAQRASILRFSSEIASLADLGRSEPREAAKLIEKLYLNYIEFNNKIYFREITPQMQGIDIYTGLQQAMKIPTDVEDLQKELADLYNFSMMVKQDIQNKQTLRLTRLAAFFLPPTLAFSIMGSNFYSEKNWDWHGTNIDWDVIFWIALGCSTVFIYPIFNTFSSIFKKIKS